MFGLGPTELILILLIILVLFGAGKLPEIGSGLGKAIQNFKKSSKGDDVINVNSVDDDSEKEINSGESKTISSETKEKSEKIN